jgi:hypothetical protein
VRVSPQPQVANEGWAGPERQGAKAGRSMELGRSMEGGRRGVSKARGAKCEGGRPMELGRSMEGAQQELVGPTGGGGPMVGGGLVGQ